jgi:hypothetical protein
MGKLSAAVLVLVFASVACLGATERLVNDSRTTAPGVVVTFSKAVRITDFDAGVFPNVDPEGSSTRFAFGGGRLPSSGLFEIAWTPGWASIKAVEWQTPPAEGSQAAWLTRILADLSPSEMPVLQEWTDPGHLYYGALTLSTNFWRPTAACYAGFERSDWQIARLRGALSPSGVVFRIEFSTAGRPSRDPAVEYEISLGSYGAVLVSCDEEGATIWTSVSRPKIHLSYYTVDGDSITVALTLRDLGSIGCDPKSLLGLSTRVGVKYRTERIHYFIYYDGTTGALSWAKSSS